ncbi:metal-binding protein [Sphingobacterium sp. N143]|uniref:Ada metal-binding domain-containing protein n=1 Tax=Sphingobacterium sp. N143 TaxID=2746727 RepID=UPI0025790F2A|nr:Ada metal-binding domain-containing protein [Sphingobacterium sp. N143]MDM1294467.1 metal-binding protein [Sphingobacterium sp. N143]
MQWHSTISDALVRQKIRKQEITLGGNAKLKIYGLLSCGSGKRMNRQNRVFFSTEEEAVAANYRPCGHCLKEQYKAWKANTSCFSRIY